MKKFLSGLFSLLLPFLVYFLCICLGEGLAFFIFPAGLDEINSPAQYWYKAGSAIVAFLAAELTLFGGFKKVMNKAALPKFLAKLIAKFNGIKFLLKDNEEFDKQKDLLAEQMRAVAAAEQTIKTRAERIRQQRRLIRAFKKDLDDRKAQLDAREKQLDERDKSVANVAKSKIVKEAVEERRNLELLIERKRAELESIQNSEEKVLDWISRMEQKEQVFFNELLADVNKYQNHRIASDGFEFEQYIAVLLEKNGYRDVSTTQKSKDYGADVLAEKDSIKYVFQCKYYTAQVGIKAVQQVHAAKSYYRRHIAVVVTNSVFTKPAKILAEELGVALWDCDKIDELAKSEEP